MSKQPETKFKERVLTDLKILPNTFAEKIQQKSIRGTLDIHTCIAGFYVSIELKTDTGKLDKLQEYVIRKTIRAGGIVVVATPSSWEADYSFLKTLAARGVEPLQRSPVQPP